MKKAGMLRMKQMFHCQKCTLDSAEKFLSNQSTATNQID